MPAEFERHSCCWMLWPERPDNWRCGAKPAQAAFAAVAAPIAAGEPVTVGMTCAAGHGPLSARDTSAEPGAGARLIA